MSNFENYRHIVNLDKVNSGTTTYREIIEKQGYYIATPIGVSMMPLIRQRVDTVRLEKPQGRCKKYDVIMYQRPDGKYILHRILKVRKDSYDLCGDNQVVIEHGVTDEMIIGVMTAFYRGEKYIAIDNEEYIKYYKKRVRSRRYRYFKWMLFRIYRKLFKIKK